MRDILRQNNLDLLREIERLREILQSVAGSIPAELDIYYDWVVKACDGFREQVVQNLHDLDLGQDDILPDVLSNSQLVTRNFHQFNRRLVSPVLRARPSDRLCLKLLRWLHSVHPQTQSIPLALSDGEFASWPAPPLPTIYFMPPSAQHGLLYLPLFFHEFGHLFYAWHRPEMDDLVRDLQEEISEFSIVVFWTLKLKASGDRQYRALLGKQPSEHLSSGLTLLQAVVSQQNQRFHQRLRLLPTHLPNGFDGVGGDFPLSFDR